MKLYFLDIRGDRFSEGGIQLFWGNVLRDALATIARRHFNAAVRIYKTPRRRRTHSAGPGHASCICPVNYVTCHPHIAFVGSSI